MVTDRDLLSLISIYVNKYNALVELEDIVFVERNHILIERTMMDNLIVKTIFQGNLLLARFSLKIRNL